MIAAARTHSRARRVANRFRRYSTPNPARLPAHGTRRSKIAPSRASREAPTSARTPPIQPAVESERHFDRGDADGEVDPHDRARSSDEPDGAERAGADTGEQPQLIAAEAMRRPTPQPVLPRGGQVAEWLGAVAHDFAKLAFAERPRIRDVGPRIEVGGRATSAPIASAAAPRRARGGRAASRRIASSASVMPREIP